VGKEAVLHIYVSLCGSKKLPYNFFNACADLILSIPYAAYLRKGIKKKSKKKPHAKRIGFSWEERAC
jgi:hypothetical protein